MKLIDIPTKERGYREAYSKLSFLAPIMIEIIDDLEGSNQYKQRLKFHLNKALDELLQIDGGTYHRYMRADDFDQKDLNPISGLDVWRITDLNYQRAFEFFTKTPPHEVVSVMETIQKAKDEGKDLTQIIVDYIPMKK